jgi:hypothetical protein
VLTLKIYRLEINSFHEYNIYEKNACFHHNRIDANNNRNAKSIMAGGTIGNLCSIGRGISIVYVSPISGGEKTFELDL